MAENLNSWNDVDSDMMDVDKVGIVDEENQEPSIKPHLAGPMTSLVCIHFILWNYMNATAHERTHVYLDDILQTLSTNNADFDNEMDKLQELAKKNFLNLYVCIKNQNEKRLYDLNITAAEGSQQWPRACVIFDRYNGSFYAFYVSDTNNKNQTVFPMNDTYTLRSFEDLVYSYNWPRDGEAIQQTPGEDSSIVDQHNDAENVSTAIDDGHAVNTNSQSDRVMKASAVCNLLVQNIQNLIPYVGSQLDSLNFSFKSSECQLAANDLTSPETANNAFHKQVQMFSNLSHMITESLKTNHRTQISTDTTEDTTTNRNRSLTNHEENIQAGTQIITEQSLASKFQSTTDTNTSQLSITTNNINEQIKLSKLKLLNQPSRFWHNRELGTLNNGCPAVQVEGAPQRTPFELELPNEIMSYKEEFYIGIHVVTYDGKEHAQKIAVPIEFKNSQSILFDQKSKGVFLKINLDQSKDLRTNLSIKMINLYQDVNIDKDRIKKDKLIWCRLRFAVYIKMSNGQFDCISPPTYSDLIEETHWSQSLGIGTIFPDEFCERGGQMIFIPLDQSIETKDHIYDVECNGKALDKNKFQISEKILSFESPASNAGQKDLHVTVHNRSIGRSNTYTKPYHSHDDHPDPCGVMNED